MPSLNPTTSRSVGVLLVESSAHPARELTSSLVKLGYKVTDRVSTSEDALRSINERRPDLVFMDLELKGAPDGIAAADQIRARFDIPVVYLTEFSEKALVERAKRTEPYGFLAKPVALPELRSTIEIALYKHEADKRIRESERRYRDLVEHAHEAIVVVNLDEHGSIEYVNPRVEELSGYTEEEVRSRSFLEFVRPDDRSRVEKIFAGRQQGNRAPQLYEACIICRDGSQLFAEIKTVVSLWKDKSVVLVFIRDLTDRVQKEQALEASARQLSLISDGVPGYLAYIDRNQHYRFVNGAYIDLFNVSKEEIVGRHIREIIGDNNYERAQSHIESALAGNSVAFEGQFVFAGGSRQFFIQYVPDIEDSGVVNGFYSLIVDVTQRYEAEKALRESEEKFRLMFELSPDIHVLYDYDGYIDCNEASVRSLGLASRENLISAQPADISPPYQPDGRLSAETSRELMETAFAEGSHRFDWVCQKPDGTPVYLDILANRIMLKGKAVIHAIARDVTDKKRAEDALRESENLRRLMFEGHRAVKLLIDPLTGGIVDANPAAVSFYGYDSETLKRMNIADINTLTHEQVKDEIERARRNEKDFFSFQHRLASGEIRDVDVYSCPIELHGRPLLYSIIHDVTDRRKMEDKLLEAEELFQQLTENINHVLHVYDPVGDRFVYVSPAYEKIWGRPVTEVLEDPLSFTRYVHPEDMPAFEEAVRKEHDDGEYFDLEYRIINSEGALKWIWSRNFPVLSKDGEVNRVVGIAEDITERKNTEQALLESEQRFRLAFESSPDAIFWADGHTGDIIKCNREAERLMGMDRNEIEGLHHARLHPPEHAEFYRKGFESHTVDQTSGVEGEILRSDGARVPVRVTAKAMEIGGRHIVQGFFRDITERKQAEEDLRLKALVLDQIDNLVAITDLSGKLLYVNRAQIEILGRSREELLSGTTEIFGEDPSRGATQEHILQTTLADGSWQGEVVNYTADGRGLIVDCRTQIVRDEHGRPILLCGVATDITERKKAEEELRLKALVLDQIHDLVCVTDLEGNVTYVNKAHEEVHGYSRQEFLSSTTELFGADPSSRPSDEEIIAATLKEGSWLGERENYTADGREIVVELRTQVVGDEQGIPVSLCGVATDITARKQVEEALRRSEAQKQAILDGISENLAFVDENFIVQWANKAAAEYSGKSPHEVIGLKCHEVFYNMDRPCNGCPARRSITTGKPERNEIESSDGRTWDARSMPVRSPDGSLLGIVEIAEDVTEKKAAHEFLLQSERYKAVADLSAGVAHNFNNLLQIILGNTDLALSDLQSGELSELSGRLREIGDNARFGAETVMRLTKFAGDTVSGVSGQTEIVDLSDLVRQAVEMTKPLWKSEPHKKGISISLDSRLEPGCTIRGDKTEIFEVMVNLIRNATEALSEGGAIEISTLRDQSRVQLRVRDTGIGIPSAHLHRIFTPFFSTSTAVGRGLGLATCRAIADKHGGTITAESVEGKGSTFTVIFPVVDANAKVPTKKALTTSSRSLRIMVIDDSEATAKVIARGLEKLGHTVCSVCSAQEGLRRLADDPVDVVICDPPVPGMTGRETIRRISELSAKQGSSKPKVIILSGRTEEARDPKKMTESRADAVVEKPTELIGLANVIDKVTSDEP